MYRRKGRKDGCQGKNIVLHLGDNTGGHGGMFKRLLDSIHSVEAKGLGVRRPVQ